MENEFFICKKQKYLDIICSKYRFYAKAASEKIKYFPK